MLERSLILFVAAVTMAFIYAFVGGFTDAANAIATSVGSRVLTLRSAVIIAAVFNLLGGLTGTAVAVTIGAGLIDPEVVSLSTVVAGVAGAMAWSLFTYFRGIPISETHGLVGGLVGAGIAAEGTRAIRWPGLAGSLAAIVISPALGFLGGAILITVIYWIFRRAERARMNAGFVNLQRISAAYMAFSHGRNDAQKPMGILAMALTLYYGQDRLTVPLWVVLSCSAVAAMGTAYGGWRIIHTLGSRLTNLTPVQGFAAEVSGASVIGVASMLGIPISTTHAITASIVGVGFVQRRRSVRWETAKEIVISWVLTLPVTIILGGLIVSVFRAADFR